MLFSIVPSLLSQNHKLEDTCLLQHSKSTNRVFPFIYLRKRNQKIVKLVKCSFQNS